MTRLGKFSENDMEQFEQKHVGKRYIFTPRDLKKELLDEGVDENYFRKECTITNLEVFIEENLEDCYWNIRFDDGYELSGISGYHLEPIK